ncbi:MAG: LysE family transporter [Phycisphaerales bacterium]|nr:LysE family transporter [Phycisphaerales bacterium]
MILKHRYILYTQKRIALLLIGLVISFVGNLPLGFINITVIQIAIQWGALDAFIFSLGATCTEIFLVYCSLLFINKILQLKWIIKLLDIIGILFLFILSAYAFYAIHEGNAHALSTAKKPSMPLFLWGILISAINPMAIPFWFGWSSILFSKKILKPTHKNYQIYVTGIGIGSLLSLGLFIVSGKWIYKLLSNHLFILNAIIGSCFLIIACLQAYKFLFKTHWTEKDL